MSFLGGVVAELLGGALEGVFSSNKPAPNFPEGQENASLGAVAGFLAFVSLLIGLPSFIFAVSFVGHRGLGSLLILGLGAGSALLAFSAIRVGSKALQVTKRNAALAQLSRAIGYLVLVASAGSSTLGVFSVLRWLA
jgi:hypothetical protein